MPDPTPTRKVNVLSSYTPEALEALADEALDDERVINVTELRAFAAAWREDIRKQVSGFYEDDPPTFEPGAPRHELQELVTAEDCRAWARIIEERTRQCVSFEWHKGEDNPLPLLTFRQGHPDKINSRLPTGARGAELLTADKATEFFHANVSMREALRWLVALKDLKEKGDDMTTAERVQYAREKPWAWVEARRAIDDNPGETLAFAVRALLGAIGLPLFIEREDRLPEGQRPRAGYEYIMIDLRLLNAVRTRVGLVALVKKEDC